MRFNHYQFGRIDIDAMTCDHDVVIDRGEIRRKKTASKKFREEFGHTPLSAEENIPWKCTRLVIGTGAQGRLPVMDDVTREARDRRIELAVVTPLHPPGQAQQLALGIGKVILKKLAPYSSRPSALMNGSCHSDVNPTLLVMPSRKPRSQRRNSMTSSPASRILRNGIAADHRCQVRPLRSSSRTWPWSRTGRAFPDRTQSWRSS